MTAKSTPPKSIRMPGRLLQRAFFELPPEVVGPRLLGKLLVRRMGEHTILAGRIVEVEAYLGPHNTPPDPAAHSHRGPTPRVEVLFGPAGHAYVYSIYGMYFCMNISCETAGRAGSILLRALEPVMGTERMAQNRNLAGDARPHLISSGPSRLCQALALTRAAHNGLDLLYAESPLQVRDDGFALPECLVTTRIGIKHAVDRELRFVVPGNAYVSGPKNFPGRKMKIT